MTATAAPSTPAEVATESGGERADVVPIAPRGDLILNVTFETSKANIKIARKASQLRPGHRLGTSGTPGAGAAAAAASHLAPLSRSKDKQSFRVELSVLKKQSKYFSVLLGDDSRFSEAQAVSAALKALSLRGVKPADVEDAQELPHVEIIDDDEATQSAHRQHAFADLLRILHSRPPAAVGRPPLTMQYVATLAVLADRFDCPGPVSRFVSSRDSKFKWPTPKTKPPSPLSSSREETGLGGGPVLANEEAIRQKILAAWLLDQPLQLHAATRALIMAGSGRWSHLAEDASSRGASATWWDLQDDLEGELRCRRECILNTIASVQRHFLSLYSSPRTQMCKLGYDSSVACDAFQLGQMVKFLANKGLLFLLDFSPSSLSAVEDFAAADIGHILATLKQCPSYQIDKYHMNCGLRIKMMPILDYIQSMLSSNVISIPRRAWKNNRSSTVWRPPQDEEDGGDCFSNRGVFRFTRSLAEDQRLRFEGAIAVDRMAKELFTATSWTWTPED